MFCTACGKENKDESKFCHFCGAAILSTANTTAISKISLDSSDGQASSSRSVRFAGFWRRFAAMIADGFVVFLFSVPGWVLAAILGSFSQNNQADTITFLGYLFSICISGWYFSKMESGPKSATFGKRWMGIKVTNTQGQRISYSQAFGRWLSHGLSYLTFYIGFLIQPFTSRKQALHDIISSTVVIEDNDTNPSVALLIIAIGFVALALIGMLAAIAIPAYQDYTIKAKVAQAYSLGVSASERVELYYLKNQTLPASAEEAGVEPAKENFISKITVGKNGDVYVIFSEGLSSALNGKNIKFTPTQTDDGVITWQCSSEMIPSRYLPKSCQ